MENNIYLWFCIAAISVATFINYSATGTGPFRAWGVSKGYSSSSGSWHK
ncbi:hypothetical protein [Neisseria sp. Ec49-e6-T10]